MKEEPGSADLISKACGAVVAAKALFHFGIIEDFDSLIAELQIEEKGHTSKTNLRRAFDKRGIQYEEMANANLGILIAKVSEGKPVIVNWSPKPQQGHYSVITGCDGKYLTMHDPDQGDGYRISLEEFDQKWISGNGRWIKWYMQILGLRPNL